MLKYTTGMSWSLDRVSPVMVAMWGVALNGVNVLFRITLRVSKHLLEDGTTSLQLKNEQECSAALARGA